MKKYEVLFIIESSAEEEKKAQLIETVKEIISAAGEVTKTDIWGNRKLAYPINKKPDGYYVLVDFEAKPELPKELDRRLKIIDEVVRHMIVCKEEK